MSLSSLREKAVLAKVLGLVAGLSVAASAVTAAPAPDARPALREMSTDRPDATESPFTVDVGHVQLEMDFANYSRDRQNGTRTIEWEAAPFNLRFGVSANFELGIFCVPYRRVMETPRGGPRETQSGFGDITLRSKWNARGNDGGAFAWGVMADLKLPTASGGMSNGKCEGALTFPFAFDLAGGWGGGAMTSIEVGYADFGRERTTWVNTLTFGHDLATDLGGFVELTSAAGEGAHVATFNAGLTRRFGPNVQFDVGINVGISRSAPDLQFFSGISRRF